MEKIKIVKTENLKEIFNFYHLIFESFPYLRKKLTKKYFEEKIKVPFGMIIKAVKKKKVLGFLVWLKENSKTAYIWWLIVFPKWQKKGIGKKLLGEALKEIQKRNCQKVWAKIKNDNFAALSLLLKFQFYIKGAINEDGIFTIFLEKNLQNY